MVNSAFKAYRSQSKITAETIDSLEKFLSLQYSKTGEKITQDSKEKHLGVSWSDRSFN